jgi:hypothetical protein
MKFMRLALSESNGEPSSTRINLLILLMFTMALISVATFYSQKLPDIPASLADLIKFLFGCATAKTALSSVSDLVAAVKTKPENTNGPA